MRVHAPGRPLIGTLTKCSTVRFIPDWFPGATFKVLAKETRDKFKVAVDGPMEYVKNAMKVRLHSNPRSNRVFNPSITPVRRGHFPVHNFRLPLSFGESRTNEF